MMSEKKSKIISSILIVLSISFLAACNEIDNGEGAAFILLGTNNELIRLSNTQYQKALVVQVTDTAGRPVSDVEITLSVRATSYRKGSYVWLDADNLVTGTLSDAEIWWPQTSVLCDAEDLNGNGILDSGEDINNNGVIDPPSPAVIFPHPTDTPTLDENNRLITDQSGIAYFSIVYPETVASWVSVDIVASARVSGTENSNTLSVGLNITIDDAQAVDVSPPGGSSISPYGLAAACTDAN